MNTKCFSLFWFLAASLGAEDLTLTKIVVVGTTTKEAAVRQAFVELTEGQSFPRRVLNEAAELAADRLTALGYFSSVQVNVVVSAALPGTAKVVAEVTDGFPWFFGGGSIWALAGLKNLDGSGQDAALWLGWNRQAVGWADHAPGWKGGSWALTAGNQPLDWVDASGTRYERQGVGAALALDQELGWGWSAEVRQETRWEFDPGYTGGRPRAIETGRLAWQRLPPGYSPDHGASAVVSAHTYLPDGLFRQGTDLRGYVPLGGGVKAAFRAAGVTQQGAFDARDALVLSGLDTVRKSFDAADLDRSITWASAELRWAAVTWSFFGVAPATLEPAVIFDAGAGRSDSGTTAACAAGVALRLLIAVPVSVPVRLEATLDNKQRLWWGLGVSAPF
jgi:hypothetical protein